MLSLAGARGFMYVLEFGWAAGVCNTGLCLCKHCNKVLQCVCFKYSWYSRYSI